MTTRDAVATTLLAAAAGVVDLWGVVSLGAFAAGVLLAVAPPVVPGLAALLVALAAAVHARPRPAPHRDEPHHGHPPR